ARHATQQHLSRSPARSPVEAGIVIMADDNWLVLRSKLGGGTPDGTTPDIILGGKKPHPAHAQNYHKGVKQAGNFGGENHVYVRTKNASADLAFGSLAVYVAYLADLANPPNWTRLHTSDGRDNTNIGAEGGKVATNGAPLIWTADHSPA